METTVSGSVFQPRLAYSSGAVNVDNFHIDMDGNIFQYDNSSDLWNGDGKHPTDFKLDLVEAVSQTDYLNNNFI
jgi:hypothetical protein